MKVTFYGTRGSTPVARPDTARYGGNTSCLRIHSDCLPDGLWLVVDAGSGIVPLAKDFFSNGGKAATILLTHYHHDHTQGFPLAGICHAKHIPVSFYGPFEHNIGAREVYEELMRPPFFPVDFKEVASHFTFNNIENANTTVIIIHPLGGIKRLNMDDYERLIKAGKQLPFHNSKFDAKECLVVRMHRSNHPEQTISYRFEEGPTGEVFVFVTDHENQDGIPADFKRHLNAADLLVMDCQYTRAKYDASTAGWGHATPDYVARMAEQAEVKTLGLTHHDPFSDDEVVESIVQTAREILAPKGITVFGCYDYLTVPVSNT